MGKTRMRKSINHPELCCSCRHLKLRDLGYDHCSIRQEEAVCSIYKERTYSNCGNLQMLFLDGKWGNSHSIDEEVKNV